jgi:hypothetical protein
MTLEKADLEDIFIELTESSADNVETKTPKRAADMKAETGEREVADN